MDNQNIDNVGNSSSTAEAETGVGRQLSAKHKPRIAKSTQTGGTKRSTKSKKDQLVALLSKPDGTRAGLIAKRLGWQAHTVRAALSGLRNQGVEIARSTSPKTGESVYAIVANRTGNCEHTCIDADGKQTGGET